ncbi:MAG: DEAD/DEAH box helicase, partial [Brachybacterium tyrofermentans]
MSDVSPVSDPAPSTDHASAAAAEAPASAAADAPAAEAPASTTEAPAAEAPASTTDAPAAETPEVPAGPTFDDIDLPAPLRRAVDELGFTVPSAIQARAIPPLLEGKD